MSEKLKANLPGEGGRINAKAVGLAAALIALALICLAPAQPGLSIAGQRMLGVMIFAVIVWATGAMSYPVSAGVILALTALLVGFSPNSTGGIVGTSAGMKMALAGFSSPAFCLVGAALFLAAAMTITGLDRRIALLVLSKIGTEPHRVVIGVILCGFILSFFVPSTTARVACLVPIVMGVIAAFKVPLTSKFAAALMITVAQVDSVWNVGIKTAAAQNMVAVNFIKSITGYDVSWLEWFTAAAPYAACMSVFLYFVVTRLMPIGDVKIEHGREAIRAQLKALGPMKKNEWKLLIVSCVLLFLWVTEKKLHPIDTTTSTVAAIALLMMPGFGVMEWKDTVHRINWGTVFLFGMGISLGSALLSTHAAQWLANEIVAGFGLQSAAPFTVLAVMAAFLIVVHLGFASATGLASAIIPIIIAVLSSLQSPGVNVIGMTMILQYVVSFGFILPVNAPQNMIAYSTGTFTVKEFAKTGLILTAGAYLLLLLMAKTYWSWLGLV
ncbi:DASS family sodium-coupled anion symporter [Mesosutterella sp. AGMB02718]|uniref:DASS family sodium-coupled anion symporter n=1 Tax=Mesosutterella faecium TaxID=2925194 RepID=A0ABT7IPD2_9BURK|nr:DASS family sodium-coupled anion symporter [Mesosutterella sp. AGMB02718]MDL2060252.1 DASS family sodium-coupled anion symporter [Mesosutterella sp. AGMB02718]